MRSVLAVLLLLATGSALTAPVTTAEASALARGVPQASIIAAAASGCGTSLQKQVDAARPGAVVSVTPCVYRETVTIGKPLTIAAQAGAEIRGSDVWTDWSRSGEYWVKGSLPGFPTQGKCRDGTARCLWPEQVFLDGEPLVQVTANPKRGEFAVDEARRVLLADDPNRRTVEVTVRHQWIKNGADGVTIRGFTMKHAANKAQSGAIGNQDHDGFTLEANTLSDTHGAVVSIGGGRGTIVLGNDISRGGQLGLHGWNGDDVLVRGNAIHHNNTEDYDPNWESAGVKMIKHRGLVLDGNDVHDNDGPGLWCDIGCRDVTISNNRVYRNAPFGIFFEISNGAKIWGNAVRSNGLVGIYVSSSANAEVYENTLAWNPRGIHVNSQPRADRTENEVGVVGNHVHHNTIVAPNPDAGGLRWAMEFADILFQPAANNRGEGNAYWYPQPENGSQRFAWAGELSSLAWFAATPGEAEARYLSAAEKDERLAAAAIPLVP